jgi:hypothetical protein
MIELKDVVSKIFYKDKNETYSALIYIDIDGITSEQYILNYITEIITKNPILKQTIIEINGLFFLDNVKNFNLNDYSSIKYTNVKKFDNFIKNILNEKFETELKWRFLWCIDKKNKKTRVYFKIHHSYADGYGIIKIITSPFEESKITNKFKRSTSFFKSLFHFFIGTIILIIMNIKVFINIIFKFLYNTDTETNNNETDYIICKKIKLDDIKLFAKKNKISVNDFLYSLMIKTDLLYGKKTRNLITGSPINISGTTQINNMCPVFININNSHEHLIKRVNDLFNNFKYSLFIPILSFFIKLSTSIIKLDIISYFYNILVNNIDYLYSNIIGPQNVFIGNDLNIYDMHFLTIAKNKEVIYNIVSSGNNVNIICTFKQGQIQNKKKFEKAIYKAYNELINS